jgi:hypothetical protein
MPLTLYPRRGSRCISNIPPRHPRFTKIIMRNTADVTGGKPIPALLQSISGVSAITFSRLLRHPWRKQRVALLLFCPGYHTRLPTTIIHHKNNSYSHDWRTNKEHRTIQYEALLIYYAVLRYKPVWVWSLNNPLSRGFVNLVEIHLNKFVQLTWGYSGISV